MDQKFFIQPFAFAGDKTPIPDALQPSGDVSYNQGWTLDYQLEMGVDPDAKAIPRQEFNDLLFNITQNVGVWQRFGTPEWITAANNGGVPYGYMRGTVVRYRADPGDPFITYISRVDTNTVTPAFGTNWGPYIFEAATNAEALAGASSNVFMTPLRVAEYVASVAATVPDATTAIKGKMALATNAETIAGVVTDKAVVPSALAAAVPASTVVAVGKTRYATTAETTALAITNAAVTPGGMAAVIGLKANIAGQAFSGNISAPTVSSAQDFVGGAAHCVLATSAAGTVHLRPNGPGSATGAFTVGSSGNATCSGAFNPIGGVDTGSSLLLKNLEDAPNCGYGLQTVLQFRTARGTYKDWYNADGRTRLFLIAENVKEIAPEATGEVITLNAEGEDEAFLSIQHDQVIPILVNAIQEMYEAYNADLHHWEAQMTMLMQRVAALEVRS